MAKSSIGKLVILLIIVIALLYLFSNPMLNTWGWFSPGAQVMFEPYHPNSHGFFFENIFRHAMGLSHLFFVIIWIGIVVWVYRDAEARDMNGFLWGLLVFVGNVIGLVVYLIIRREQELSQARAGGPVASCPNCGKAVEKNFVVCPYCQTQLKKACPSCGEKVQEEWVVCPYCKSDL